MSESSPGPEQVYLADSWVLSVQTNTNFVGFLIQAVLERGHPLFYWPPHAGEQYPYANMQWRISGEVHWNEGPILDQPAIDASGERDFGNVDAWWTEGDFTFLEGDWGSVRVRHASHAVEFQTSRIPPSDSSVLNDELPVDIDQLEAGLRDRLMGLLAARGAGGFRSVDAVLLGADLVAAGIDDPTVIDLAIQPADPNVLRYDEVCSLFDACCASLGLQVPSKSAAGWRLARDIATTILTGVVPPGEGAARLWPLWEQCGVVPGSDPLDMLQLFEEWEGSVGEARDRAEARIVESAHSVVADADRAQAAMSLTAGFAEGVIRAQDAMPLLLRAAPSFLKTWYEIEEDHSEGVDCGGRLDYLDAGAFARHAVEMHRSNHREWLQNAFDVIERMHIEGDDYVRELATIGYLEDIENMAGHGDVDPAVFEQYLGPESRRWWKGLQEFWSGQRPTVVPVD